MIQRKNRVRGLMTTVCFAAMAFAVATPASAQVTTGTIRGDVSGVGAGETVTARNVDTGLTRSATTSVDGTYQIAGLRPGVYEVTIGGETETVRLLVGQALIVDLGFEDDADVIVVQGTRRRPEVITSEVATNVTTEQIETLPQSSRNFLNFAQLAPGVRVSRDEFRQQFSGGASNATGDPLAAGQTNVFIDGVSLKSNINQGGLVGQDASRGNPFSQLAVQEFRVLTQNFKAEYEQAGTSIITAVTKSGTNEFEGQAFGLFQRDGFRENDFIRERRDEPKPEFSRTQYGAALGGPIIEDKLFFFVSYEANDQDRVELVVPGQDEARLAELARIGINVNDFIGSQNSPFREDLYFAKLDWNINEEQTAEVSYSRREESDIRGFGGQNALERATNIENDVTAVRFKHQYSDEAFLNEFSLDYLNSLFSPSSLNPDIPGRDFQGVINIGGNSTIQEVEESNITLRNNVTFSPVELAGEHLFKFGLRGSFQEYRVVQNLNGNPIFTFELNEDQGFDFDIPTNARFGVGDPELEAQNTQFGLFIQDDWNITDKLQLNIGLRWDVELNANNKDFVTPDDAVFALRELEDTLAAMGGDFDADDYISTGENRSPFLKAIQPRVGFSYDLFGDSGTVIFGGYGRFYDRTLFRNAAEEALFRQRLQAQFFFSEDGSPRPDTGQPTIAWDPSFLSREGLLNLLDDATISPVGELRVYKNDQRPPRTDQFSAGVRQRIWLLQTSLTYSHIRGENDIAYFPANRTPTPNDGGFFEFVPVTGFGNVVASDDTRATRFNALYATIDKPYSEESGWSLNIAYTHVFNADQRGRLFNFDDPRVGELPFLPNDAEEKHRIVVSGIVDLPFDFRLSTLSSFATGQPPLVIDATEGFGANVRTGNFLQTGGFDIKQVDLRLEKEFEIGPVIFTAFAEGLNVFDSDNGGFNTIFVGPENDALPDISDREFDNLAGPPRTLQLGGRIRF